MREKRNQELFMFNVLCVDGVSILLFNYYKMKSNKWGMNNKVNVRRRGDRLDGEIRVELLEKIIICKNKLEFNILLEKYGENIGINILLVTCSDVMFHIIIVIILFTDALSTFYC